MSNFYPIEKAQRTAELLKVVELEAFAKSKVKVLSGGQKQRVAIARALAKQPEILLLDEPFSHIDNFKKQSLRRSVFKYLKEKKISCVVATHDKNDVLGFADQMMLLNEHKILEKAAPETLYKRPKTALIASFFGEFTTINNQIIYAHQLSVVAHSHLKVSVIRSYFNGRNYLIESTLNDASVFFEHHDALQEDTSVYLEIKI